MPALRHLITATVTVAALSVPVAAQASALNVTGTGNALVRTKGPATVWAVRVTAGRLRLITADGSTLRLLCVKPDALHRRCARRTPVGAWIVLRPVKFLYNGTSPFQLMIHAKKFDLNVLGSGRVRLNGTGTYTLDGSPRSYAGLTLFKL